MYNMSIGNKNHLGVDPHCWKRN